MAEGTICRLIHLCSGSDFPSTHLVSSHNGVGYGYIESRAGDVFFDDLGLKNLRFDQLRKDMLVEYVLEEAPYLRASSVVVLADRKQADDGAGARIVHPNLINGAEDQSTKSPSELIDAVDASSIESFPASDSPAHWVSSAPKPRRHSPGEP